MTGKTQAGRSKTLNAIVYVGEICTFSTAQTPDTHEVVMREGGRWASRRDEAVHGPAGRGARDGRLPVAQVVDAELVALTTRLPELRAS